tara:strand:+ start:1145 stop:1381 length:237 start_codon:yes stop_codon:yes gene_type:complete
MNRDDITLSHLLANPIYVKRQSNIEYSVDNEIKKLLNKKFEVELTEEKYKKIIIKIEKYLIELEVEQTINRILDNINE